MNLVLEAQLQTCSDLIQREDKRYPLIAQGNLLYAFVMTQISSASSSMAFHSLREVLEVICDCLLSSKNEWDPDLLLPMLISNESFILTLINPDCKVPVQLAVC